MSDSSSRKIMIGDAVPLQYQNNIFALKLLQKINNIDSESINAESRLAFLSNFIFEKKAYELFLEIVSEKNLTVPRFEKDSTIELNALVENGIRADRFPILHERLSHLPVSSRAEQIIEMALNPHILENDEVGINLASKEAERVSKKLLESTYFERVTMLFEGSVFESLKSDNSNTLVVGKVILEHDSINPKTSEDRLLDTYIPIEQIDSALDYVNTLDRGLFNLFMARAIVKSVDDFKGLQFRIGRDLPFVLSEVEPRLVPINTDLPIINDAVRLIQREYELKNNRIKDRFGASDSSMLTLKVKPNDQIKDPVTSMLARVYFHYPEFLTETLPKNVDIEAVIKYLGGSDRSFGAYIGRNQFTAHRYLTKGQQRPQHVALLLEIFARFVQNGRIQEYIEKIVMPEAKSRGIKDVFGSEGWPRETKSTDDE